MAKQFRIQIYMFMTLIIIALMVSCQSIGPAGAPLAPQTAINNAFVFTAAGDYGSNNDTNATLDGIARSGTNLHLALGDLSYSKTLTESAWCDYVRSKIGATLPFQLIAGNHEDDFGEDGHIEKFAGCLPDKLGARGEYARQYYFDYGDLVRFIMISPDLTIRGEHYYYGDVNEHYQWVAKTIDDARAANIPWVIVGMHKNCLSMGEYYCRIYADLMNLLVDKKVDLVLSAHDHTYQRTKQLSTSATCITVPIDAFDINCVVAEGKDGIYTKDAGPIFVIAGTAGADLYNIHTDDTEAGYFAAWMGANSNPRKGFMKFKVSATQIVAEFVGSTTTSNFTDNFTIKKRSANRP